MTPEDIEKLAEQLAPKIIDKVHENKHEFWLDPEEHYNEHKIIKVLSIEDVRSIRDMARLFVYTKGLFWKAFLGFAIIGAIVLSAIGLGFKGGTH